MREFQLSIKFKLNCKIKFIKISKSCKQVLGFSKFSSINLFSFPFMEKYEDKFDFKEFERRQLIAAVVSAKEANIVQEVRKVLRSGHRATSVD